MRDERSRISLRYTGTLVIRAPRYLAETSPGSSPQADHLDAKVTAFIAWPVILSYIRRAAPLNRYRYERYKRIELLPLALCRMETMPSFRRTKLLILTDATLYMSSAMTGETLWLMLRSAED